MTCRFFKTFHLVAAGIVSGRLGERGQGLVFIG